MIGSLTPSLGIDQGCSKSIVEECLGIATYMMNGNGYDLCTFVSDIYVVQTAFDSADTMKAYLITEFNIQDSPIDFAGLGADSPAYSLREDSVYYPEKSEKVFGYVSQGSYPVPIC